jgi:hypothetical protein
LPLELHATANVLKALERLNARGDINADMVGRRDGSQCIHLVVHAAQGPAQPAHEASLVVNLKILGRSQDVPVYAHLARDRAALSGLGRKPFALTPATHVHHALQARFLGIDNQPAFGGHGSHQVVKLAFNGFEVIKDVGVVKLKVVQNRCSGPVVYKFAAFVKKCGVVLIGFDHKEWLGGFAVFLG